MAAKNAGKGERFSMSNFLSYILNAEFAYSVLRVTTPILFAALASVVAENSGASNIALEGIMLFAALFGALGTGLTGSLWLGFLIALGGGLLIAVLLAYFALYLKTDIILSGIALNTLATGGTVFIMYVLIHDKGGTSSLPSLVFPKVIIPGINAVPVLGTVLSGQNILTYTAFFMVFAVWVLLYKTKLGMHIRCVGENPDAAESVGIPIRKTKVTALMLSGLLASLGGVFLSMAYMSTFTRGMVAGRGFIALAAAAMGRLSPVPTMCAALFFGFADALSNVLAAMSIPDQFIKTIPYASTVFGLIVFSSWRERNKMKKNFIGENNG